MTRSRVGRINVTLFALAISAAGAASVGCGSSTSGNNNQDSGTPDTGSPTDTGAPGDTGTGPDTAPADTGNTGDDTGNTGDDTGAPTDTGTLQDTNPPPDTNSPCPSLMAPTFTPATGATGALPAGVSVTITDPNTPATGTDQIFYTTNGTVPTAANGLLYLGPISLTNVGANTIIAVVVNSTAGCSTSPSPTADAQYTVTPMPQPEAGTLAAPILTALNGTTQNNDFPVSATDSSNTATICFTLDGSTPACNAGTCQGTSKQYDASTQIPINGGVTNPANGQATINAIACEAGFQNSALTTLTATLQAAAPTMVSPSPGPQLYSSTGYSPTISSVTNPSTPSATTIIRYTLAPAAPPTCNVGTVAFGPPNYISGPVGPFNSTQTFQTISCKTGYAPSAVVNFTYTDTLNPPTFPAAGKLGAPGATYDYTFSSFGFTNDGLQTVPASLAAATAEDPNWGATDLWECYTLNNTTPVCGSAINTCATPATQFVATKVGNATLSSVAGYLETFNAAAASAWVAKNQTIQIVACSDKFTSSSVSTGTYSFQLDPPALWSNGTATPKGPGCTPVTASGVVGGVANANSCPLGSKIGSTAIISSYSIPTAAVGSFQAGIQQDFGVDPLASQTAPAILTPGTPVVGANGATYNWQVYDWACATASGTAACGPAGTIAAPAAPTCTGGAAFGTTGTNAAFYSAGGFLLGGANTVQVGQTWSVQGCSATGAFTNSAVSKIAFVGPGKAATPTISPTAAGPYSVVTSAIVSNADPSTANVSAANATPGATLCITTDGTVPASAVGGACSSTASSTIGGAAGVPTLPNGAASPVGFAVYATPNGLGTAGYATTAAAAGNIINGGTNQGVILTSGGSGYTSAPTVTFGAAPTGGTTALATATLAPSALSGATITNGGSGYPTSGLGITITGGGGAGATATLNVSAGVITSITLTNAGANYTSPPTFTLTGNNGGTGAAIAFTLLPSAVQSIVVSNAGAGYTSAPTITISGGGGTGAAATAYLENSVLVIGQQDNPENVQAAASNTGVTQSVVAAQTLNFKLNSPDLTLQSVPVSALGNLDTAGTVGAGQQVLISTTSNFSGETIWYNTGATPTDCAGSNNGVQLTPNFPAGCSLAGNAANGFSSTCTGRLLTIGGAAANGANNIALPTSGSTIVVNTISCSETSGPSQTTSASRTSTLTVQAAQPLISSNAGGANSTATPGPITTVYDNVVTATITDPSSVLIGTSAGLNNIQICYRTNGTTPSCTGGVCDPNSSVATITTSGGNTTVPITNAPGTGTQLVAVACLPSTSSSSGLAQSATASATFTLDVSPVDAITTSAANVCPEVISVGLDCAGFEQFNGAACVATGGACTVANQATTCCSGTCNPGTNTCAATGPYCSQTTLNAQGPTKNAWICYSITGTVPQSNCYGPAAGNPPSGVPSDVTCFNTTTGAVVNSAAGQTFIRPGGTQYVSEVDVTVNPTALNTVSCATGTAAQAAGFTGASAQDLITPAPFSFGITVNGDLTQFASELPGTQMLSNNKPQTGGTGAATDAYMSYDTTNLYFGYGGAATAPNNEDPSGGLSAAQIAASSTYVTIYLGNATGEGATVGPAAYNPAVNPTLPVVSTDVIVWEVSLGQATGAATALTYNGAAWVPASYTVTVGYQGGDKASFSIPLAGFSGAANGPPHVTMFGQTLLGVGTGTVTVFNNFPTSAAQPAGYSNFVNANRSSCLGPAQQLNVAQ